jgi:hypothetical protein
MYLPFTPVGSPMMSPSPKSEASWARAVPALAAGKKIAIAVKTKATLDMHFFYRRRYGKTILVYPVQLPYNSDFRAFTPPRAVVGKPS